MVASKLTILTTSYTLIFAATFPSSEQSTNLSWKSTLNSSDAEFEARMNTLLQKRPTISVVMVIRNDDYGGRLLDRFMMSLSTLSSLSLAHGLRMELIIVEWNPPGDKPSIRHVVDWPKAIQNISFIGVSSDVHQQLGCKGWEYEGKNLGISLAQGQFILATNADIIFTAALIRFLSENKLCEDCYYRVNRHDVVDPVTFGDTSTVAEVEQHCEIHSIRRLRSWGLEWHPLPDGPTPHVEGRESLDAYHSRNQPRNPNGDLIHRLGLLDHTAAGDFMLMHRRQWRALGGFARESFCGTYCDNHTDSYLVAAAAARGLRQVRLDPPLLVYHQEHYRTRQQPGCPPDNWLRFTSAAARMLASRDWTLAGHGPHGSRAGARPLREGAFSVERWSPLSDSLGQSSTLALGAVRRALWLAPAGEPADRPCGGLTPGMRPGRRAGLYTLIGNYLAWQASGAPPPIGPAKRDTALACYAAALDALAAGGLDACSAESVRAAVADGRARAWRKRSSPGPNSPWGRPGQESESELKDLLQAVHTMTSAGLAAVDAGGSARAVLEAEFWMERAAFLTARF